MAARHRYRTSPTEEALREFRFVSRRERLERALRDAFDADPLEDGVSHPAEQIVAEAVGTSGALDWLRGFVLDTDSPTFGASTLRSLGRLNGVGTAVWRTDLVRRALTNEDVQVRDAALQAAEAWDGADLRRVLIAHLPFEPIGWLREAMQDVAESGRSSRTVCGRPTLPSGPCAG